MIYIQYIGNKISIVQNLASLQSLTELNLRRNFIEKIFDLDKIPSLQRVFLSHNSIRNLTDMLCIFEIKMLVELSLDGNPICEINPLEFRHRLIAGVKGLRHLDLKRISDEDRMVAETACVNFDILAPLVPIAPLDTIESNSISGNGETNPLLRVDSVNEFLSGLNISGNNTNNSTSVVNNDKEVATNVKSDSSGLASLARSGRIAFSTQGFFDLEVSLMYIFIYSYA
jgi:hypothetical protein